MIEIPEIRRPSPPTFFDSGFPACILEVPIAEIFVESIAAGVPLIKPTQLRRRALVELLLCRDSLTCGGPHIRHIHILPPVIVKVAPGSAHAGRYIFDMRRAGHSSERTVAIVPIKIVPAKIIRDIQVGKLARFRLAPGTRKAVAIVIHIQSSRVRLINECPVTLIVE